MRLSLVTALIIGSGVLLAACSPKPTPETSVDAPAGIVEEGAPPPAELETSSEMAGEKLYSLAEIAPHNKATDCWFVIDGIVYDVTPFIASGNHPGGAAILAGCGKDATELFNDRPNDKGPHSEQARAGLENFKIGRLEQLGDEVSN